MHKIKNRKAVSLPNTIKNDVHSFRMQTKAIIITKMHPIGTSCASLLTAITFRQVSLNPMAVPKPILLHLKRSQRTIIQNLIQIKNKEQWSKYTSDDL